MLNGLIKHHFITNQ